MDTMVEDIIAAPPARSGSSFQELLDMLRPHGINAQSAPKPDGSFRWHADVAVGAGMDLSLMCDLRFAGASARFAEAYIRVGLLPGNGGCYFLPRLVGPAKALELLWTGDFVSAEEALKIGLVNRVYSDDALTQETLEFAARLAEGPPIQQREIKKLMYQGLRTDLRTSLESVSAHMAVVQSTGDYKEAIQAYKEKRKPIFRGK